MNNTPHIALLCNSRMAIPALQTMIHRGVLCGICTSDKNAEVAVILNSIATQHNIPFKKLSYRTYKEDLAQWLGELQPDIVFVMTFAWRIPMHILSIPTMGFLNFHYGLLPEMRGADPIFESIRQCKQVAGTTVHVMDEDFDTGAIIAREELQFSPEFTYGMLSSQLSRLGDKMCTQIINDLQQGKDLPGTAQDGSTATYWPRLPADSLFINWEELSSREIKALVKACNPIIKGTPTIINGWTIGICEVMEITLTGDTSGIMPGQIICADAQNGLLVFCKDGIALKLEVIYSEEGVMPGHKLSMFGITPGMRFSLRQVQQPQLIV